MKTKNKIQIYLLFLPILSHWQSLNDIGIKNIRVRE